MNVKYIDVSNMSESEVRNVLGLPPEKTVWKYLEIFAHSLVGVVL